MNHRVLSQLDSEHGSYATSTLTTSRIQQYTASDQVGRVQFMCNRTRTESEWPSCASRTMYNTHGNITCTVAG